MRRRSSFGWLELIIGIPLIVLGIWTFADPQTALSGMVFVFGIPAVITGVSDIILYVQVERYTGFGPMISLISGILSVMSGIMLMVYPGAGVMVLTLLFPIWFIAHCISRLTHLPHIRLAAGRGMYIFSLVMNVMGLILGIMMLFSTWFTLSVIRWFVGAYLIFLGVDSIITAISPMGKWR